MVQNDKHKSVSKKYLAIVKIGNNADGTANCIKYRFDDLLKFAAFLDKKWDTWKWFNVYSNRGVNKREQVGNFTNKKRPNNHSV
ncbi:MAG: hypothetical protein JW870_17130 [Candidatus Delongbacteria bacterium]|nr:hypothetical protein [Candidatus Delongbacteria bacterium]